MPPSLKRRAAAEPAVDKQPQFLRNSPELPSSPATLPSLWRELPIALFDRVCSYATRPVVDTLLSLSAVCREWSQLLDGDACGRYYCWRHVPQITLQPSDAGVLVGSFDGSVSFDCWRRVPEAVRQPSSEGVHLHRNSTPVVQHRAYVELTALMSHTVRRLRSIDVSLNQYHEGDVFANIRLLDLLFPSIAPSRSSSSYSSSSSSSSTEPSASRSPGDRVWLDHLTVVCSLVFTCRREREEFGASLSTFILRCPPLRSFAWIMLCPVPVDSTAILRHLCSGGRLQHLQLDAEALSAMVWADNMEATATVPWRGATTVESFVLCAGRA